MSKLLCSLPSGHCPHHEVPKAVDWAMLAWMDSDGQKAPVCEGQTAEIMEMDGRKISIVGRNGHPNSAPTNVISNIVESLEGLLGKRRL